MVNAKSKKVHNSHHYKHFYRVTNPEIVKKRQLNKLWVFFTKWWNVDGTEIVRFGGGKTAFESFLNS